MIIFNLLKIGFVKLGLDKCIGGVNEQHIKARMTNKFSGFKEKNRHYRYLEKKNKSVPIINLEITKEEWFKNAEILCSNHPDLYEI